MAQKFRSYCFTDFEMEMNFYAIEKIKWSYIIIGEETCPSTGKKHWQGYIYFSNARSMKSIIKLFDGRHIEICKGNASQNIDYCSKEENIILENGEKPKQGKRNDLDEIKELIKEGKDELTIADSNFTAFCRYGKSFEKYRSLLEPKRNWKTEVIILWGPTGTGKTRKAVEDGGALIEYTGQFWQGYENQEIVIWDDFDPTEMPRGLFLKLTDQYALTVNIKNGQKQWNPRKIYITSNYNPDNWYGGDAAVKRRFTKVEHMTGTEVCEGNTKPHPH